MCSHLTWGIHLVYTFEVCYQTYALKVCNCSPIQLHVIRSYCRLPKGRHQKSDTHNFEAAGRLTVPAARRTEDRTSQKIEGKKINVYQKMEVQKVDIGKKVIPIVRPGTHGTIMSSDIKHLTISLCTRGRNDIPMLPAQSHGITDDIVGPTLFPITGARI